MALSESALSELLVVLTDRDRGVDLVRELAQWLAQELIEVQATQAIGAGRCERNEDRVTERDRAPAAHVDHEGRRSRVGDPEAAQGQLLPVDPAAVPADRPGLVRGRDGGLRVRRVDPLRGRSGRVDGRRQRDLQVGGLPDLCRARRTGHGVPQPHARPHRVPVRVLGCDLCPRRR